MAIGEIVVSLLAKTGAFDTDIERSTKATEKRMREMRKTVEQAGTAFGVALGAGAAAAVFFTKQWIDSLDALNDAADATGASVENLSALEDVALRTGTSMDTVTAALLKFNMGLQGTDDDGKAAKALEAIGLKVEELRKLDPADALLKTAQAMAKFADDGDKGRLMLLLFGKNTREVAAYMKDLAEKGQLVATVTGEQAKEAEAFNKELFAMQKNVTDLGRAFATDLVTGINNAARTFRENGSVWDAIKMLFGGTDQYKADKRFAQLTDDLLRAENEVSKLAAAPLPAFMVAGNLKAARDEVARIRAELTPLLAARQAPAGMSLDQLRRAELAFRPSIGAVDTGKTPKSPKGPKGPDPDADFKAYLNNLQQQIQKVNELTASEKLLYDIRRGQLTVTPAQEKQLAVLAKLVDKHREWTERMKDGRLRAIEEGDAVTKANEAYQERLKALLDAGPAAQLEQQRAEMKLLADEFQRFIDTGGRAGITQAQYLDAVTGRLNLVAGPVEHMNFQLTESQNLLMEMGSAGVNALEDMALHSGKFSDVLKGLLMDLARMIFQLGVAQPLMRELRGAIGGGVTPPNPDAGFSWGNLFKIVAGSAFGGLGGGVNLGTVTGADMNIAFRAVGGPVSAGSPYMIGERGPEMFVPRTAGTVVPNHALGGGNTTIINQTTGRVDRTQEQRLSNGDRVLYLQEAVEAVAAQLRNPNSKVSQSLHRNTTAGRRR